MNDIQYPRRVAFLVGSLRADSLSRKIAKSIAEIAQGRIEPEFVPIADLPLYDEDAEMKLPAAWQRFRGQIARTEGIIFCTPEYNRGVPGALKNAIDVGSRPAGKSAWSGKPCAVISLSPGAIGGFGANHQLRQLCVFLDMPVLQQPEAYLGNISSGQFDDTGMVKDEKLHSMLRGIVEAYLAWLTLLSPSRAKAE
jgi:chromate reductase